MTRSRSQLLGMTALLGLLGLLLVWMQQAGEPELNASVADNAAEPRSEAQAHVPELAIAEPASEQPRRETVGAEALSASADEAGQMPLITVVGLVRWTDGVIDPKPLEGAKVSLSVQGAPVASAVSGADGRFEVSFRTRVAGLRRVVGRVWAPGFGMDEDRGRLSLSEPVELSFKLEPGAVLQGKVVDAEGQVVESCSVFWLTGDSKGASATTNERGQYSIEVQEAGHGRLMARMEGVGISKETPFEISAKKLLEAPTLVLQAGHVLAGRVVDPTGRLLADVDLYFYSRKWAFERGLSLNSYELPRVFSLQGQEDLKSEQDGLISASTKSASDGSFEVRGLAPGVFRVFARDRVVNTALNARAGNQDLEVVIERYLLSVHLLGEVKLNPLAYSVRLAPITQTSTAPGLASSTNTGREMHARAKDRVARFRVQPNTEYMLSVNETLRPDPGSKLVHQIAKPVRQTVWIGALDYRKQLDITLKASAHSGTLRIDKGWADELHLSESVRIRVRALTGESVSLSSLRPGRAWHLGLHPGQYRLELTPKVLHGRIERTITDSLIEACRTLLPDSPTGYFTGAESGGDDWYLPLDMGVEVRPDLTTEIPIDMPLGGRGVFSLRAAEGASKNTTAAAIGFNPWGYEGVLVAPDGNSPERLRMQSATYHLPTEMVAYFPTTHFTSAPLPPGLWTWKVSRPGCQPLEVEFEIKPRCFTTVVGVLKPN